MSSFIIHGGSPVYQRGLHSLVNHFFPQLAYRSEAAESPLAASEGITVQVLPPRAQLGVILELAARLQPATVLWVGDFLLLRRVKTILANGGAYLLRDSKPQELQRAVRALLGGEIYIDAELRNRWLNRQLGLSKCPQGTALTKRERQITQLIVTEMTTGEIARELFISPCTVENHRANILQKLGARNTAGIVREALRLNLVENH